MELGLLLIRLVVGLTLAAHGAQKLFGMFGGHGLSGTGTFMESLGFHPGRPMARLAGLAETGGGLALAIGFLMPFAAGAIIAVMLVAIATVHIGNGFFNQGGGVEHPVLLSVSALGLALTGAGTISLDALLGLTFEGFGWGVAALVIGLVGALIPLGLRSSGQPHEAHGRAPGA